MGSTFGVPKSSTSPIAATPPPSAAAAAAAAADRSLASASPSLDTTAAAAGRGSDCGGGRIGGATTAASTSPPPDCCCCCCCCCTCSCWLCSSAMVLLPPLTVSSSSGIPTFIPSMDCTKSPEVVMAVGAAAVDRAPTAGCLAPSASLPLLVSLVAPAADSDNAGAGSCCTGLLVSIGLDPGCFCFEPVVLATDALFSPC
mmetsp:Transcript_28708/g.48176  ORF Transcript_28708/g.48176 Transcript_28708/m.48176 type:complete len:200 (-) Transcript_28708:8-607(-)